MDLSNKNVIHIKKDGIEYLQFRKLLEYKHIINHAYSLGLDKNFRTTKANKEKLDKNTYDKAIQDYKKLCEAVGCNYKNLVKTNQDHTSEVKVISKKINLEEPDINMEEYTKTDGLITNKKELILSTTNADCILLLFFDPIKKVIANTHSGWKGTLQRISVKTVEKMVNEYNCNPKDIICCITPSIRKCHFEVKKDVKDKFATEFNNIIMNSENKDIKNEFADTIRNSQDFEGKNLEKTKVGDIITETVKNIKWNIDTIEINKLILKKQGLNPENIIDSGICSVCNSNIMHSFRAEKEGYGLNTAIIELK